LRREPVAGTSGTVCWKPTCFTYSKPSRLLQLLAVDFTCRHDGCALVCRKSSAAKNTRVLAPGEWRVVVPVVEANPTFYSFELCEASRGKYGDPCHLDVLLLYSDCWPFVLCSMVLTQRTCQAGELALPGLVNRTAQALGQHASSPGDAARSSSAV